MPMKIHNNKLYLALFYELINLWLAFYITIDYVMVHRYLAFHRSYLHVYLSDNSILPNII
jgi:hypothetical protein